MSTEFTQWRKFLQPVVTGLVALMATALAANGKTSGTIQIRSGDGTTKSYTFPLV
jgi:hypothetical protein